MADVTENTTTDEQVSSGGSEDTPKEPTKPSKAPTSKKSVKKTKASSAEKQTHFGVTFLVKE